MIEEKEYQLLCQDLLPLFNGIAATEKYAITLGGSHGKGLSDRRSDFDFRVYYDERVELGEWQKIIKELHIFMDKWKKKGVEIDGVWPRSIKEVDEELDRWISGKAVSLATEWSVWGYELLTDIFNQAIVEDPFGVAQGWKDRLSVYPEELKVSILSRYGNSLKYWRNDYHYLNKVVRKDVVFLASLSARLIHDIMQVIYALNHFYFPGDGMNLVYTMNFNIRPENLEERVTKVLYPSAIPNCYEQQYHDLLELIDDVLMLM